MIQEEYPGKYTQDSTFTAGFPSQLKTKYHTLDRKSQGIMQKNIDNEFFLPLEIKVSTIPEAGNYLLTKARVYFRRSISSKTF